MKKLGFIVVFCSFLLTGCSSGPVVKLPDGTRVHIEIAQTNVEKQEGLMNRTEMDNDQGMLFVYETEQDMAFWMKNTLIPLDIIFIGSNQKIVDILTMQPCKKDPCPSYPADAPAQYALEVNEGMASEWGLEIGDLLTLDLSS
ncbi:MAG: DUF192 domain-containing protein [Candidatus Gracilibacteria bacterium]|nr:DUF192 domain-containing protein [Candidatus Gracilibacteria bacterium]